MSTDRFKGAWSMLQNLQDPMGAYARTYRAKVVAQTGDADEVDVRPDDPSLPDMAKVPLRHGIPGAHVQVQLGSYLLIGWDDGRPDKPFAALWSADSSAAKTSIVADTLNLGSQTAVQAAVLGTTQKAAMDALVTALDAYVTAMTPVDPTAGIASAALKAALTIFQSSSYLSAKVRVS